VDVRSVAFDKATSETVKLWCDGLCYEDVTSCDRGMTC